LSATATGFDRSAWQAFAELGWLSLPFSEALGGFDGNAIDLMVVAEAFGKGLVREPFLPTVVTCGGFLQSAGSGQQQQRYVPAIIDGSAQWAFAFAESGSGYDLGNVQTTAQREGDAYMISGHKVAVLNAHCAEHLIVSARTSDPQGARTGITLFIVDAQQPGVQRDAFVAVDGSRGAHIALDCVQVPASQVLGEVDNALPLMTAVLDTSIVAIGAEAVGCMQTLLDTTVAYTKTREQFGQPISKFQVLQHRMADMYLKLEETRSLLLNAAIALDANSSERASACAALKVKVAEAGRYIAQESVQLHGGIGMTDELCVGHHYKRLLLLARLYGDEAWHLQRFVDLSVSQAA
jgi:alkylation response protein AidB-like acyl-CoA dehydrogenase